MVARHQDDVTRRRDYKLQLAQLEILTYLRKWRLVIYNEEMIIHPWRR